MGDIESNQLSPLNMQINAFCGQCKSNLNMLNKFKDQIDKLESEFNNEWGCDTKLNSFFFAYEQDVLSDYLLSLNNQSKKGIQGLIH